MVSRVETVLVIDQGEERVEERARDYAVVVADRETILANGSDMALVTYDDPAPAPPASVTFYVNGTAVAVDVDAGGTAELEVVTTVVGPIRVSVPEANGVNIIAEAP